MNAIISLISPEEAKGFGIVLFALASFLYFHGARVTVRRFVAYILTSLAAIALLSLGYYAEDSGRLPYILVTDGLVVAADVVLIVKALRLGKNADKNNKQTHKS